jgi:transposase-like protein
MTDDTVVDLRQPGETDDPLTAILRTGARQLLAQAVEAEVAALLAEHTHLKTEDGRQRLVRPGHGPEREILTGIGPVPVRRAKIRDRGADGEERLRFTSAILPPFARRTRSVDAVLPSLYLRGLSSGDFQEALEALLGKDASGLSPQVISRLKMDWQAEHDLWRKRDLSARRYVYIWADGVYLQGRLEDEKQCILVIIGATPEGKKDLIGFQAGFRESTQSWRELLVDLKGRGLVMGPKLAVGDGALGFWKALDEVFPGARHQRCWVHKTANILNKLPKSRQKAAKDDLHAIWMAEGRADAEKAMDTFAAKYEAKYPQATACLTKALFGNRIELL